MKRFILFCLIAYLLAGYGFKRLNNDAGVYGNVLRLHVIGNSNSAFDQQVKLKVKDRVSREMAGRNITSYEEAIEFVHNNEEFFIDTANEVLKENGAEYTASMETGVFDFPEKNYGRETFKAGKYNAVRLRLGKAEGENWWCVLFPPVCFMDSGNGEWDLNSEKKPEFKSLLAEVIKK